MSQIDRYKIIKSRTSPKFVHRFPIKSLIREQQIFDFVTKERHLFWHSKWHIVTTAPMSETLYACLAATLSLTYDLLTPKKISNCGLRLYYTHMKSGQSGN